ncbi:phycobilisome protein [Vacuolonema iberomarrocanum]|uniref:phycobilisome protein n=1 Tax=Vacuolonema iberomarrocanum TaxID=3454632 RepID=UPI0019DC931A|nr:phycobilisome protein [filamentous cyanobacterium LEGE 07170]
MYTFNHDIDQCFLDADGAYLDARGLQMFESFAQTYSQRLETYNALREQNASLVQGALKKMSQMYPGLMQRHGKRCQYDMSEVVRYMALAILRDDEVFFKEMMMSWLDTVLVAYKHHNHCATAYRLLQEMVDTQMPESRMVVRPYLDSVISILQSHA